MDILSTEFDGLFLISPHIFKDHRGAFIKQYNKSVFCSHGLKSDFVESFYSVSQKGIIRGMHFQIPPKAHTKLVYVSQGSIIDVVLDLRKKSSTYGKYYFTTLSSKNNKCLYISEGFAHGFLSLEDNTCVHYMQTSEYNKDCDKGVHYECFGFPWIEVAKKYNINNFVLSTRDLGFTKTLGDYF